MAARFKVTGYKVVNGSRCVASYDTTSSFDRATAAARGYWLEHDEADIHDSTTGEHWTVSDKTAGFIEPVENGQGSLL